MMRWGDDPHDIVQEFGYQHTFASRPTTIVLAVGLLSNGHVFSIAITGHQAVPLLRKLSVSLFIVSPLCSFCSKAFASLDSLAAELLLSISRAATSPSGAFSSMTPAFRKAVLAASARSHSYTGGCPAGMRSLNTIRQPHCSIYYL